MATALREIQSQAAEPASDRRLATTSVFVLGTTGAGAAALAHLARAGVGTVGFADDGDVQPEDLAREVLHGAQDLGRHRALSARDHLRRLVPECRLRLFLGALTEPHAADVLAGYEVVIDAGGDPAVSGAAADYCRSHGTPLIRTEVAGATARVWTVLSASAEAGPDEPLGPGAEASAFDAISAAVAGALAAGEALRILLGEAAELAEETVTFEARTGRVSRARKGGG
jgi:adenylyltransferase/sulfurtransferase